MNFKEEYKKLLGEVKKALKRNSLPARNEDIAQTLGYNRAYFSTLLGENGKVTKDHLNTMKLTFAKLLDNPTVPMMVNEEIATYGRVQPSDYKVIQGPLPQIIGKIEEDIIRIDAIATVLSVTVAEVVSQITGKSIGNVSVEISKAIDLEVDRLYAQLGKKRPLQKS